MFILISQYLVVIIVPRKQVYDIKRQMRKVDEIDDLLQYTKNSEEPIVLEHHDVPEDLWVLAKPHMTTDLSRFCTSDQLSHPLSVDPKFYFGKLDVTPFTYKHLFLKSKYRLAWLLPLSARRQYNAANKRASIRKLSN